jgi:hypothetical protein
MEMKSKHSLRQPNQLQVYESIYKGHHSVYGVEAFHEVLSLKKK